ncbi:hemerythrin family protein [Magnetospira thiophila]
MIEWTNDLSVGIEKLDDEHKQIIQMINAFIAAVDESLGIGEIHDRFRDLQKFVYFHFGEEEDMMLQAAFEDLEDHKRHHQDLASQMDALWDKIMLDPVFKSDDGMREWLESWLFRHVKTHDFQYRAAMWRLQTPY